MTTVDEPNDHVISSVISAVSGTVGVANAKANALEAPSADPRTELDSHANMVVLGSDAFIFESTGSHSQECVICTMCLIF